MSIFANLKPLIPAPSAASLDDEPPRDLWLLVTGCRELGFQALGQALGASGVADRVAVVLTGDAPGVDQAACSWALGSAHEGVTLRTFAADWDKHGKAAGPIRNSAMINHTKTCPDPSRVLCLAVLNDLSRSENAGTRDAIAKALRAQIPCRIFTFGADGVMREESRP